MFVAKMQLYIHFSFTGTTGSEFVLAFTETDDSLIGAVQLLVSNVGTNSADVSVTTPLFDRYFRKNITIRGRSSERIVVPEAIALSGSEKSNKAVLVTSTNEISVVGLKGNRAGGFLAVPVSGLGTEYYAVTHFPDSKTSSRTGVATIGIAATADGTTLSVALPPNEANPAHVLVQFAGGSYRAGDVFSVDLQKHETFQIRSNFDLTATHVYSNLPVSVFSGSKVDAAEKASFPGHLVAQLPAVHTWGRNFTLPFTFHPEESSASFVRIITSEPSTVLALTGRPDSITMKKPGTAMRLELPESLSSITANKPIQVVQFPPSGSSMVVIPPVEQYSTDYVFQTPQGSKTNNLILVCPADKISGFHLTGSGGDTPVSDQGWQNVPRTDPQLMSRSVPLPSGMYRLFHQPADTAFAAILSGYSDEDSYALPLGYSLNPTNVKVCCLLIIYCHHTCS